MFKSYFKDYIKDFLEEKRTCGYKYTTGQGELERFDSFLYLNNISTINQDVISLYIELYPNWNQNTKARNIGTINELLKYLNKHHINEYIISKKTFKQIHGHYIPYIFSIEELHKIFEEADRYTNRYYLEMKYIIPTMLRLLYGTGIRLGECLEIKRSNIDLEEGTIILESTKNGIERLTVLSDSLIIHVKNYLKKISIKSEYLFCNLYGKKLSRSAIEENFYKILEKANIKRTDDSPRVHDLRFTFITHSFRRYCETGKDPMAYLPILQTYVGHQSYKALEYYIKTTKLDQDDVRKLSEERFGYLIPNLGEDNE